jgi:hypothetical protein
VLDGAKSAGATVELINLYDYKINHCIGCWSCYTEGKCIQEDDFEFLYEKYTESAGIVLGSPVYMGTMSGVMKNFFDRFTGYAMYNPKGAAELFKLPTFTKVKTLVKEISRFGPKIQNQRGKRFVLVMASTLPFPYSFLTGQSRTAMKSLACFVVRMKGKIASKLMYTDSLIRIRMNEEKKLLNKAYSVGRKLFYRELEP